MNRGPQNSSPNKKFMEMGGKKEGGVEKDIPQKPPINPKQD